MKFDDELLNIARLALTGRRQDIQLYLTRLARQCRRDYVELSERLNSLLEESPSQESPLRSTAVSATPVDINSRLQLVRTEAQVVLDVEPIFAESVSSAIRQIADERQNEAVLAKEGLSPSKTILFTGPPGVGKTLAARWLAQTLRLPLLTLDLSAVISSFLGKTGMNVRNVLEYAKSVKCVLLLDELDAVAKRRDDGSEIGELKRLVTVLLQEIDDWPSSGILVAATNHPTLLDPAVWRRFDMIIQFPMPNQEQINQSLNSLLTGKGVEESDIEFLSAALSGMSFSDIEKFIRNAHRHSVLSRLPINDQLRKSTSQMFKSAQLSVRKTVALRLKKDGHSDKKIHEWTGIHRDTLRKNRN